MATVYHSQDSVTQGTQVQRLCVSLKELLTVKDPGQAERVLGWCCEIGSELSHTILLSTWKSKTISAPQAVSAEGTLDRVRQM